MRVIRCCVITAVLFVSLTAVSSSLGAVQITGVTSDLTGNPKAGDSIHLMMNAVSSDEASPAYRFYYKSDYGTGAFATNRWKVVQEWGPANGVEYSFVSPGNNYLVGHIVSEGESWRFGDAQGGFNVVTDGDIQITAVTSSLAAVPEVGDTLRLRIEAVGPEWATLHYRFYYRAGYGLDPETWGSSKWQLARDWGTEGWFDYTFADSGDYYLVGHVKVEGDEWEVGDPQGGFNAKVIDPDRPDGWTEVTHGDTARPNHEVVYAQDVVKRIDLFLHPADWQAMMDDMTETFGPFGGGFGNFPGGMPFGGSTDDWLMNFRRPIYRPCTVMFEGKTWSHVGLRFKGNSSLGYPWLTGNMKLPFRFDVDEFEDEFPEIQNQRFYGFKELSLSNNSFDDSLLREKVAADVYREAGVPTPQTAFYRVFVDSGDGPIYFGVYTMVEVPREPLLESHFGESGGNLYKPEGEGAKWVIFDKDSFAKATNEDEADWSDVEAAFAALHAPRSDPAAWRAGLEAVFDVDGFLRWLAANTVMQNWDTYGNMPQNYYLYTDLSNGLLHWIPWDFNEAFKMWSMVAQPLPLSLNVSRVDDGWPLIRYLIDDPVYKAIYVAYVNDILGGAFSVPRQQQRLQDAHALISPYVIGPGGEQSGYTFTNPNRFESEYEFLLSHVEIRRDAGLEYLTNENFVARRVVINEIHYNPSAAQGDEDYEFIELFNAGASAIDLSGFAFVDGIEFTFPQGASIASGEYFVLARNALAYIGKGYQVFEWTSGQLANEGETVRLKDAMGIEIDRVQYDDQSPWPTEADGDGPSLELINATADSMLPDSWEASSAAGGTPGRVNDSMNIAF